MVNSLSNLLSELSIPHLTTSEFYLKYVSTNMSLLPAESRGRYLYRLRAMFEYDDLVDLRFMRFISPPRGVANGEVKGHADAEIYDDPAPLRRACEFYSSHNEIYRVMLKRDSFLPEPYDNIEWFVLHFLNYLFIFALFLITIIKIIKLF